ncbi:hypothetical protein GJAV_G00031910 [Gymnothorax javanicus]|nr:hypothetical protein GJAV_G00031910 [Gymnothorax javanicus]
MTYCDSQHTCGLSCLGPLAFHTGAAGDKITLTYGAKCAERDCDTFRNAVVFSNRPVRVMEKVRLRVDRIAYQWHGALRLGFTTIRPASGPQADMVIPNLTKLPGYWAAPVPEAYALPGSVLQFWVTSNGELKFEGHDGQKHFLLVGVDISKPLWAMIDVYGQTCTVALLGSKKKCFLRTRESCPTLSPPPAPDGDCSMPVRRSRSLPCQESPRSPKLCKNDLRPCRSTTDDLWIEDFYTEEKCVVCLSEVASVMLCCGHQCLCTPCAERLLTHFRTCPLCRKDIR